MRILRDFNLRTFVAGLVVSAVVFTFGSFSDQSNAQAHEDPLPDLVEKVRDSVVNISSETVVTYAGAPGWEDFLQLWGIPKERKQSSLGSGFISDPQGYVITNYHVVREAEQVNVTLADQRKFRARWVGGDSKIDVALLQLMDPGRLKAVSFGDSERVRIAETVVAIGNPFGLQNTVTRGIISAKNRTIGVGPFDNFLQTDASINPGNSGGPLFNLRGEVIGVNTLIFSRTGQSGGVGFATPINEVRAILEDLKKYGRVPRPWLGVLVEKVTPQLRRYYQLGRDQGVVVYNLVASSPAARNGLKAGDIVFEVNGKRVEETFELEKLVLSQKPNETVEVKIQRGSQIKSLRVKLTEFPSKYGEAPQGVI